jgi:general secretion pathway protein A
MSLHPREDILPVFPRYDEPAPTPDSFLSLVEPSTVVGAPDENSGLEQPEGRGFLETYGLTTNPFADCVNPGYFYRTEAHAEAFRTLMLAIEFDASLGLLTGPSGMGKTLVSQLLLEQLEPAKYCAALVLVTPGMGKSGLLREILSELSIPLPVGVPRVQDLVKILANHIIQLHAEGRRLVLVIDESHLLNAECLHIIRTISNIEIPSRKLVTCLLFGEERLAERLKHPSYESLNNRIYLRAVLAPMSEADTAQYVKYRLMVAGRLPELYTPEALAAIHRHAGGVCRSINKLGMLSLIEGAARQQVTLDEALIDAAAARM